MKIGDLITPQRVYCNAPVASKKRALELLGELIVADQEDIHERVVFDCLLARERLGSTGLGHGVALPHGRLGQHEHALGAFISLTEGIDFDALDQQPVHLIFALLVPEHYTDEHLKIIAFLAEMFSDRAFCQQLADAQTDASLFELLDGWDTGHDDT